jgi:hypothetical protein
MNKYLIKESGTLGASEVAGKRDHRSITTEGVLVVIEQDNAFERRCG